MFLVLPLFLAVGFAVGVELKLNFVNVLAAFSNAGATIVSLAFLLLFGGLAVRLFGPVLAEMTPRGLMIAVAGLGVGAAAGHWYAGISKSSDKLIFISASAFFLVAAALEYDTKIFGHLTKFGAGNVNVEFDTGASRSPETAHRNQTNVAEHQGGPFPGSARLDLATYALKTLGTQIVRDEQYSHLFAGVDPIPSTAVDIEKSMDAPTMAFGVYFCGDFGKLARDLWNLQQIMRSETPTIPRANEIAGELRLSFFRTRDGESPNSVELRSAFIDLQNFVDAERPYIHSQEQDEKIDNCE